MKIIVGVKYCGHCNPLIEGPEIVKKIKLLQPDKLEFVSWHEAEKDILLIVSGCTADCAERPPFNGPVISVAGSSVERIHYALTELPGQILKTIKGKVEYQR